MHPKNLYRTWIEIETKKLYHNVDGFFKRIPQKTRLMAVVKSNAYGHGIVGIADALSKHHLFQKRGWFGVDSIVEAVRLRSEGFRAPILVLGHVLPGRLQEAEEHDSAVTISTFDGLYAVARMKKAPVVHLKFDTGMHRQGFFKKDVPAIIRTAKKYPQLNIQGAYTHFALAKDSQYPAFTNRQYKEFQDISRILKKHYAHMIFHSAASGGTLLFPETHGDMVRIGMGLYGYFLSAESKIILQDSVRLCPILTWKSSISEVKNISKGEGIGYDLSYKTTRKTRLAIVPIGYWHGFDRRLSSIGHVLVRGKRAPVRGRVSMDMITIDCTDIPKTSVGDTVTIIGADGREIISAEEMAERIGTSPYEILTRINPLIHKIYM